LLIIRHFADRTRRFFELGSFFSVVSGWRAGCIHLLRRWDWKEINMCIINDPPEIHLHQTTTVTPAQFVTGLTDFGPGRSKLFGNSSDQYLKVHYRGRSQAEVSEGSRGVWERLQYDWSDPDHVVLTTMDSNVWGGASGHTYNFTRQPNGTTDIDLVVVREGKNWKGRMLGFVLRTIGKRVLQSAFEKSVKAIEARNGAGKLANHQIELCRMRNAERCSQF